MCVIAAPSVCIWQNLPASYKSRMYSSSTCFLLITLDGNKPLSSIIINWLITGAAGACTFTLHCLKKWQKQTRAGPTSAALGAPALQHLLYLLILRILNVRLNIRVSVFTGAGRRPGSDRRQRQVSARGVELHPTFCKFTMKTMSGPAPPSAFMCRLFYIVICSWCSLIYFFALSWIAARSFPSVWSGGHVGGVGGRTSSSPPSAGRHFCEFTCGVLLNLILQH